MNEGDYRINVVEFSLVTTVYKADYFQKGSLIKAQFPIVVVRFFEEKTCIRPCLIVSYKTANVQLTVVVETTYRSENNEF